MDRETRDFERLPQPKEPITAEVLNELPRSIVQLFLLFAKPFRVTVFGLIGLALILRLTGIGQVYATKLIIDTATHLGGNAAQAWQQLLTPLLCFIGIILFGMMVEWVCWFMSYNGRIPLLARGRQLVYNYVHRHTTNYFDNMLTGKVAYRAMMMPEQISSLYERMVWEYLPVLAQCAALLIVFFVVQPVFALILACWLMVYAFVALRFGKWISRYGAIHSDAKAQLTGRIVDGITNIKNIIFFAAHEREERFVGTSVASTYMAQRQSYVAYVKMRVAMQFLHLVIYSLIFPLAIHGLVEGRLTPGDFLLLSTLTIDLVRKVFDLSNSLPETLDMLGSIRDSIDMLVVPRDLKDAPEAKPLKAQKGDVAFTDVTFAYEGRDPIFTNFSLHIPAGQRVGLIGMSGAGKTTLAALLMRLYDVQSGSITIDGQNIAKVTQQSLRSAIGLIPQDTMLFHRTLMDNIRYGRPEATDEEVMEAARRAYAHDFIMSLPKGYLTLVGERGVKLSGGQRQRVAIARAILRNAPILVLDEATSALDSESEAAVQAAMAEVMRGKTVVAIAHRLSTIAHLDRLIVLEKGQVVEDGSHRDLLEKNGVYAQLWQRQSGGFLSEND